MEQNMFAVKEQIAEKIKENVMDLYQQGKYKEVIVFVDSIFGWKEGEIEQEYTKEKAEWCLRQLGVGV